MNPLYIGAAARWLMIVAGARGVSISEDLAIQTVSGLLTLVALLWSIRQKRQQVKERRR